MVKTAYELERDARIAQNKERLNELNIPQVGNNYTRPPSSSAFRLDHQSVSVGKSITDVTVAKLGKLCASIR